MLALATSSFLSSCVRKDYYTATPVPTYQNVYDEEFEADRAGWNFTDSYDSAYADVQGGTYEVVDYSWTRSHNASVATHANFNYDFQIQTRIQSNNQMALIFGASNNNLGYSFFIDNTGYFAVYYEGNGYPTTILNWQSSSAISINSWNNLEIDQQGNYWIGYINNVQVFKVQSYQTSGSQCGFMVMPNTTGYADYLTVHW